MVQVVRYDPGLAPGLANAYNGAVRSVAHCHPVTAETMAPSLPGGCDAKGDVPLHSQEVLVALAGTAVVGFAHVGVGCPGHRDTEEAGILRFLWYAPGYRSAGQELLRRSVVLHEPRLPGRGLDVWLWPGTCQ